jgi:methyl-accepting chemotaxis protein
MFSFFRLKDFRSKSKRNSSMLVMLDIHLESIKVAADEMISNTNTISKNTSTVATMMNNTLKKSEEIEAIVKRLNENSEEIDAILEVVSNITQQTNLLALNASIEAARAGEAGKGFAVVANEVKDLSKQAKTATKEIRERIELIQNEIKTAQNTVISTTTAIRDVSKLTQVVASAVEKQSFYNHEIANSISDANRKLKG